jgi:hypothetical protein
MTVSNDTAVCNHEMNTEDCLLTSWNYNFQGQMCIAHVVCSALHLDTKRWHLFRDTVGDSIRIRRTNTNTAMKKVYIGKRRDEFSDGLHGCFLIALLVVNMKLP